MPSMLEAVFVYVCTLGCRAKGGNQLPVSFALNGCDVCLPCVHPEIAWRSCCSTTAVRAATRPKTAY
jgi:hypothetical protein